MGTCWPQKTAAKLPSVRRCKALRRPRGRRGAGAYRGGRPPTASLQFNQQTIVLSYAHNCHQGARAADYRKPSSWLTINASNWHQCLEKERLAIRHTIHTTWMHASVTVRVDDATSFQWPVAINTSCRSLPNAAVNAVALRWCLMQQNNKQSHLLGVNVINLHWSHSLSNKVKTLLKRQRHGTSYSAA